MPGATLRGGLSCFHGTRPLVPTPFYRNARPHYPPGASHGFTQSHNRKTPSRHTTANSTHKHDSTEAETSVCPSSSPVPGELLIPDGNGKSHTSQKHAKATTTSHSVVLATVVPLSTNPQLPGQGQGVGSPWCDHLGILKKDLSLCHRQFSSNQFIRCTLSLEYRHTN